MNIGVISYCDKIRTYATVNHQYYADLHQYTYIYDVAPTKQGVFKNKVEKILKYIDLFDYVFWIDDDAFITNFSKSLETFIGQANETELIYCKSPVNNGIWTYISSGNFFLKNTDTVKLFLQTILDTPLSEAEANWSPEEYGHYTVGDQDIMTYLLHADSRFSTGGFHQTLPYEAFNTRPFHFADQLDEHFLVHFTGKNKFQQSLDFAKEFGLSEAIIPEDVFAEYKGVYAPNDYEPGSFQSHSG
jgi:hypothetical protein